MIQTLRGVNSPVLLKYRNSLEIAQVCQGRSSSNPRQRGPRGFLVRQTRTCTKGSFP